MSHPFSISNIYYYPGCQFSIVGITLVKTTEHEMIPAVGGLAGMSGAVRGIAGYRWDYWTDLVGTTDFDYQIRTDNIEHFE
jgi:hypothetical protein